MAARDFFINCLLDCDFVFKRRFQVAGARLCALARETNVEAVAQTIGDVLYEARVGVVFKQFFEQVNVYYTGFPGWEVQERGIIFRRGG